MANPIDAKSGSTGAASADREERRQQRMNALRQRRTDDVDPVIERNVEPTKGKRNLLANLESAAHKKTLGRAYRLLIDTPEDATGKVPGTPFTRAGVGKLVETLKQRSGVEGAPGARVAGGFLKMLTTKVDDTEVIHGISLEKLQRISKVMGNLRKQKVG